MTTRVAMRNLKTFLSLNYPETKAYNIPVERDSLMQLVYDKNNIIVYYCKNWNYLEIYGLTQEEYASLITKYGTLKKFNDIME